MLFIQRVFYRYIIRTRANVCFHARNGLLQFRRNANHQRRLFFFSFAAHCGVQFAELRGISNSTALRARLCLSLSPLFLFLYPSIPRMQGMLFSFSLPLKYGKIRPFLYIRLFSSSFSLSTFLHSLLTSLSRRKRVIPRAFLAEICLSKVATHRVQTRFLFLSKEKSITDFLMKFGLKFSRRNWKFEIF